MNKSISSKRVKSLGIGMAMFATLFIISFFAFTYDFGGSSQDSQERSRVLKTVDAIEDAYFGISPFWLDRYGISIQNEDDLRKDIDNDGLDLLGEYTYLSDPLDPDTDKDGYDDGQEVKNGYNPVGEGRMDVNKNDIPDSWEQEYGLSLQGNESMQDNDGDGLMNNEEFIFGTDPKNRDTDGDGYEDKQEIVGGYDPAAPGEVRPSLEIVIGKVDVSSPIILSNDVNEQSLQKDLENGVILYPEMSVPGQSGNSLITGHSSNYSWAKGDYNYIFKDLNKLEVGDEFTVRSVQENGRTHTYVYRISEKYVANPDDVRIFEETDQSMITLVTCWPLNTDWRRLIIKSVQI